MIDWDRVAELQAEIGAEDFTEIAGLFLSELQDVIGALAAAGDSAVLSDGFHSLKGSALNLGFADLAGLCACGEADPATADIARIRDVCDASARALRARHPGIAA